MIHVDPARIAPADRPDPAAAAAEARALIVGQMAMLTRLAQIGMEVAEACGRQAAAQTDVRQTGAPQTDTDKPDPAEPARPRDLALVFARAARAVRLTIALQARLAKDLAALDRDRAYADEERRRERRWRLQGQIREAAKTLVVTRRQAEGDCLEAGVVEAEIELLSGAAYERLTEAEDGYLMGRPFAEVVARICRDLGMTPDGAARLTATAEPPPDADPPPRLSPCPAMGEGSGTGARGAAPPGQAVEAGPDRQRTRRSELQ